MPTNTIGMSVPGVSGLMPAQSLGDQVKGETEEQRRKRLLAIQQSRQLPVGPSSLAAGYGDALNG